MGSVAGRDRTAGATPPPDEQTGKEHDMSKRGRKKKARKSSAANHGKRPNT